MNWTVSRETMSYPLDAAGGQNLADGQPDGDSLLRSLLSILNELEESLKKSQHSLMARDLAGLELSTTNQKRLISCCEEMGPRAARQGNIVSRGSPLVDEFKRAQRRVLHLAQVQSALLRRAQRFLTVLARLSAGPGAVYAVPAAARGNFPQESRRGSGPCRA